jgi:hypothetical protein
METLLMSNLQNLPQTRNSITGVFGTGKVQFIYESQTFVVPAGITSLRVRVWGNGGSTDAQGRGGGGAGGFAMKTITGLTSGASISATIGTARGATNSFGSYVSATGGANTDNSTTGGAGGAGIGGDINNTGGKGQDNTNNTTWGGGGGAASLFGKGGDGWGGLAPFLDKGFGGACGAAGFYANNSNPTNNSRVYSPSRVSDEFYITDLDYIGTGYSSSAYNTSINPKGTGINGAGGSGECYAQIPAGGSAYYSGIGWAAGFIVVEY